MNRIIKHVYFDKIANNVVPYFFFKANVLSVNPFASDMDFLKDLNSVEPKSVFPTYRFASPLMIRTQTSDNVKR